MKKIIKTVIIILVIILIALTVYFRGQVYTFLKNSLKYYILNKKVEVPNEYSMVDKNNNGRADCLDLVYEAEKEVENKTQYKSQYYDGGYPPDTEGVCTDVIWRAFKGIDVNIKDLMDKDIKENTEEYYWVKDIDPNIDFRRVPNMYVFFERNAEKLTTEIIPGDIDNLKQWQPGDIIVILSPYQHVAIVSNKRTRDGVPYVIHNTKPHAVESPHFNLWKCEIAGHYRWKY